MYVVTLTNTLFETVIQNRYYDLPLSKNEVTFIYRSQYSSTKGFTIEADTGSIFSKIDYILVSKVTGENITLPSITQNTAYALNKSSLFVN